MKELNVEGALTELNKMVSERITQGTITAGTCENNMRVKFSDLRRILEALNSPKDYKCPEHIAEAFRTTGRMQERDRLKEKFDAIRENPHICKQHLRDELFGKD